MGAVWSWLKPREPKTPIQGIVPRLKNLLVTHHRGLLGALVPLFALPWFLEKGVHHKTVTVMWLMMSWFFLIQPVSIPVTGLIPIFMLPMSGSMSTDKTCGCYMNEGIALFVLASMLVLLWNNSGLDRRIALWFLCSGDTKQFSANRLLFKCSTAAFFLSMFSSRLIVCSYITQYITPILTDMRASKDTKFEEMQYIVNNAIQTSCAIGSIAIIHSSFATLTFRAIFYETTEMAMAWPDIFNYLEYSSFAFPMALVMLILNMVYNMLLLKFVTGKPMTDSNMASVRNTLLNNKKDIPKNVTLHEKLSLFFSLFYLMAFFFRWTKYLKGWSNFKKFNNIPAIRDASVAAFFVILLHALPCGFRFIKIFTVKKKSQLGALKPESGILWWRFVDKNTNYGYFFLIGAGVALSAAIRETTLDDILTKSAYGKFFTDKDINIYLLLVCLVPIIMSNMMTSVAVVVIFIPFVMSMHSFPPTDSPTDPAFRTTSTPTFEKIYLGALAAGIGSSLGFMCPFLYTPAYFSHHTGKVPKRKMAIYGLGSAIICFLILWLSVTFYAPLLWDKSSIKPELAPIQAGIAGPGAPENVDAGGAGAPAANEND